MTVLTLVAAATPQRPPSRPSRLLDAGLIAGPLFTLLWAVRGGIRDPVSDLALGAHGWVQIINFLIAGLLTVLFAIGLRRSLGTVMLPVLVAVWGAGLLGAGAFVTDPVGGPATWHGQLHDLAFSLPGFAALALAMIVSVRRGWFGLYAGLSATGFVTFFVLATIGFREDAGALAATAGLWQRVAVTIGWLWLAMLALKQKRYNDASN